MTAQTKVRLWQHSGGLGTDQTPLALWKVGECYHLGTPTQTWVLTAEDAYDLIAAIRWGQEQ